MTCPRCGSEDIAGNVCQRCRIAYDNPKTFEPHTREHTMVAKRWVNWTWEQRLTSQQAAVKKLLGV